MRGPFKIATIDDYPANGGAVPADIFGQRMNNNSRAVVERAHQKGRCCIVDNQWHPAFTADFRHFGNRKHLKLRIRQCLGVIGAGVFIRGIGKVLRP